MSYIDTFDHELVGFFAGLPLYHPLEGVAGTGGSEFGCTPDQLVLGGGDGEHPAIVLTQPAVAVKLFLQAAWPPDGPSLSEVAQRLLDDLPLLTECLQFAGWGIEEYESFHERCRSSAFVTPYHDEQDGTLEEWVLRNLGEFVYFALPELAAVSCRRADGARRDVRPGAPSALLQCADPAAWLSLARRTSAHGNGRRGVGYLRLED